MNDFDAAAAAKATATAHEDTPSPPPFISAAVAFAALRARDEASMELESVQFCRRALACTRQHSTARPKRWHANQLAVDDALSADLLVVCLGFLDLPSLAACELVSHRWHRVLQEPTVWEHLYIHTWRYNTSPLALPPHIRTQLLPHWRAICQQRMRRSVRVRLSTRMRSWTRYNSNVLVHNNEMRRHRATGCTESMRTEHALPLLSFGERLDRRIQYFEATIAGCGSIGVASVSTAAEREAYGAGSEAHVGWYPVSYGYHGDDGGLYCNVSHRPFGAIGGSVHRSFGPTFGDPTPFRFRQWDYCTIGCGVVVDAQQLFFTLNGAFVGVAPMRVDPTKELAAAVSLHQFGDSAELNFGANAFAFDIEAFVCVALSDGDGSGIRVSAAAAIGSGREPTTRAMRVAMATAIGRM